MFYDFTDEQNEALAKIFEFIDGPYNMFTLAGYAGVGKTTVMVELARLVKKAGRDIVLTAPTNKAVRVLRQSSEVIHSYKIQCLTIYSLLGLRLDDNSEIRKINYNDPNISFNFMNGVIVIDEASMICKDLYKYIEKKLNDNRNLKVIFVGDPLQLPPIGEKKAYPFTKCVDSYIMTKVIRQALENPIIKFTVKIREAIKDKKDFFIEDDIVNGFGIKRMYYEEFDEEIRKNFSSTDYTVDNDFCRVLSFTNKSVNFYNSLIRKELYGTDQARYIRGERITAVSPLFTASGREELIMCTDEEAVVEDIISLPHHPSYTDASCYRLVVFDDNRNMQHLHSLDINKSKEWFENTRTFLFNEAKKDRNLWRNYYQFISKFNDVRLVGGYVQYDNIRPAHAMTVHKSQGSTFDNVFIDFVDIRRIRNHTEMLKCLYVAVSRARDTAYIRI